MLLFFFNPAVSFCQSIRSKWAPSLRKAEKWQSFAFWRIYLATFSCFKSILDVNHLRSREPLLRKIIFIYNFSKHLFHLCFFFTAVPGVSLPLMGQYFSVFFPNVFSNQLCKIIKLRRFRFRVCCVWVGSSIPPFN